jgi:hypothetical protein
VTCTAGVASREVRGRLKEVDVTNVSAAAGGLGKSPTAGGQDPGPDAVFGSTDNPLAAAVVGANGKSGAVGMLGTSNADFGGDKPVGVSGRSDVHGVVGIANTAAGIGVYGGSVGGAGVSVMGESGAGTAIAATCHGAGCAGKFSGKVDIDGVLSVTDDILLGKGGDVAERFVAVAEEVIVPGTVVCMSAGGIAPSDRAYDQRVVGIVSGTGSARPAVTLRDDLRSTSSAPIALVGTVYCLADAAVTRSSPETC